MSNLKALFGIDFSTDLFIESAEMVLLSHLKRAINYKIEGINEITEKFNNQKPYVPKPFGLDIIKKKISEYIKIMSVINQLIIDFVKTGMKVPIPHDILEVVSKVKKPAFMQNKKGRWVSDKKVEVNAENFGYILKAITAQ